MKKLVSLMLALLMLFSCVSVATASAAYTDGEHLPQVYVEGLESKGVYYKEDTEMENPLFFNSSDGCFMEILILEKPTINHCLILQHITNASLEIRSKYREE